MGRIPPLPRALGLVGLLPQWACVLAVWFGPAGWRWTALALGFGYAVLILSFLGGLWWGIAASRMREGERVPGWLWFAAVLPSLYALAMYAPWVLGWDWPQPQLGLLGTALIGSLWVDRRIAPSAPDWWMALRIPLSWGLGLACVLLWLG